VVSSFFSSILEWSHLDVYYTYTHDMALVREREREREREKESLLTK